MYYVKVGKRNIALSQIKSWKEVQESGLDVSQDLAIIGILKDKNGSEMTSRQICNYANFERSSVVRSLNSLVKQKVVVVSSWKPCKITGKKVNHYLLRSHFIEYNPDLFESQYEGS